MKAVTHLMRRASLAAAAAAAYHDDGDDHYRPLLDEGGMRSDDTETVKQQKVAVSIVTLVRPSAGPIHSESIGFMITDGGGDDDVKKGKQTSKGVKERSSRIIYGSGEGLVTTAYPRHRYGGRSQSNVVDESPAVIGVPGTGTAAKGGDSKEVEIVNVHASFSVKLDAGTSSKDAIVRPLMRSYLRALKTFNRTSTTTPSPTTTTTTTASSASRDDTTAATSQHFTPSDIAIAQRYMQNAFIACGAQDLRTLLADRMTGGECRELASVADSFAATARHAVLAKDEFSHSSVYYVKDNWDNSMHMASLVVVEHSTDPTAPPKVTRHRYDSTTKVYKCSGYETWADQRGAILLCEGSQVRADEVGAAAERLLDRFDSEMLTDVFADHHFALDVVDALVGQLRAEGRTEDAAKLVRGVREGVYGPQMSFIEAASHRMRSGAFRDNIGKPGMAPPPAAGCDVPSSRDATRSSKNTLGYS